MMAAPGLGSPPDRGARGPVIRFRDDGAEIWPSSMPIRCRAVASTSWGSAYHPQGPKALAIRSPERATASW